VRGTRRNTGRAKRSDLDLGKAHSFGSFGSGDPHFCGRFAGIADEYNDLRHRAVLQEFVRGA
jgi:hypothetical protein